MALFHLSVTQTKRSAGQSAIASAAYRAGERLYSEYYGEYSDYTRKGGVICSDILLPSHAPPEYADRQTLWNAVEKAERGKNAQLAYSFDIALQNEFSLEENIALARQFLLENFVSRGMVVDFAVHQPDREDGGIPNPHFHVLCPIRPIEQNGKWGLKQRRVYELDEDGNRIRDADGKFVFNAVPTTDWGSPETLEHWREAWAEMCNAKFAEKGLDVRIDHRSYERQGVDLLPTIHEGATVRAMEKKGIRTEKGEFNRWIKATNAVIKDIRKKISLLFDWITEIKAELAKPQTPDLVSLLNDYYTQRKAGAYSQKGKISNLKEMNETYNYLRANGIYTLEDLESRLQSHRTTVDGLKTTMDSQNARMKAIRSLNDYSATYKLINYFDPSVKFELVLFNRQVNEQMLTEQFDIPWQEDDFNDIREEYTEMLKKQAAKGNNGIIKSKYLIFGVESNGYKEAKSRLNNIEKDVIRNLNNIGTLARGLDGKERLRILHEYFNQDTMEPFRFSFKDLAESGKSVKDYIAPPGFDFRYPNRFKSGNMYGCVSYLDIIAPKFTDELIKNLLDIDANLTISMHMQTEDPVKAIKKLKAVISNIQKMKIEEQKKAVRSGYDMDILPTDIVTYEKNTLEFLDDLNTSNQKMINMTFLITCYGRTKRELESLMQRVSGIIQQANCDLRCLQYLQEQGLMASAPIGCNETGIERTLSTKSTAILVPFCTQELFMPAPAIYYGLNALSNNMIMADRKRLRTPNGVILGTPGSGKSFSAKREILSCFLITKDDIIICDPEGEYFALVAALHGQVVKLATNSKDYLNPMDIQLSHKGDKEALKLKSDFIITLCDLIAGGKDGLENDEKGIIDECIRHIYDKYFENPVPENMPLLEDLYDALLAHKNPKAERIANSLVLYVHGSQNYFNHHTNVDSGNRIMCFDIRDLGNQLKELGMLIVQDAVWNRVSQNRERKIATRYYCDEFHLLLKEKQTAIYSVEIWKRFRKWGGIPTGLTQNVGDFLRSEEIEGILGNSDFVYLLNQNAKDQAILADKLGLSDKQLSYVTNSEPGSGLILFDNVVIPFVDKYPTDTKTYRIMNTKPEESVQKEDAV